MKKILYIVFAFYFLTLATKPCGDSNDCNDLRKSELCSSEHEHDQESHEDEDCTPLCTCSCCAAMFVVKDASLSMNQVSVINTIYTSHPVSPEQGVTLPIWQPPKIS